MKSVRKSELVGVAFDDTPVIAQAPKGGRKSWFGRFMLALMLSRQRAALRELAMYADIIDLERRRADQVAKRGNLPFP